MKLRIAKRGRTCFFPPLLVFFLLVGTISAYAAGARVNDFDTASEMKKAIEYIDAGRLDESIMVLVEIAQNDPEQMERVQGLILEIREFKAIVNNRFEQLNQAIFEGDEDRADKLIREIKSIDTAPNRNTLNNLILAAIVVGKAKNDSIRDEYFTMGNALLERGEYREAVSTYRSGFISDRYLEFYDEYIALAADRGEITKYLDDLDRQEKIWDAYGSIGPEGNRLIQEINVSLDSWNNNATALETVLDSSVAAIRTNNPADWNEAMFPVADALENSTVDIGLSTDLAANLTDVRDRMNTALNGIPEDFRYERILRFLEGRPGREESEGIRVTQIKSWESAYNGIIDLVSVRIQQSINSATASYRSGLWDDAENEFTYSGLAAEAVLGFIDAVDLTPEGASLNSGTYFQYVQSAVPAWNSLVNLGRSTPEFPDFTVVDPTLELVSRLEDPIITGAREISELKTQWDETENELSILPGADNPKPSSVNRELQSDLDRALQDYEQKRLTLLASAIGFLYENLERATLSVLQFDTDEAKNLIEGVLPPGAAEGAIPERWPRRALDTIINPALARQADSEIRINDFLSLLRELLDRTPVIENAEEVEKYRQEGENLLLNVAEFASNLRTLESDAQRFVNLAQRAQTTANNALTEAREKLQAARNAVNQGSTTNQIDYFYRAISLYDAVEDSLDRVDAQYLQILINDADIAADSGIQASRGELRNQVQADRNRLAVTVKQNAVDEARVSYEEARYTSGVGILNQAQEFWNSVYNEDDAELEGWLVRLRNAQQALQQTVIEKADPLYAEMNQYLNLANRYYNDGVRVAAGNPRNADAIQAFRASADLVRQVLNTFPGNEAALLLEQKILRQTDEDAWNRSAQALVTQARRAITSNDVQALRGSGRQKGLYAQLKVLQSINPGFPNIVRTIYDAEVLLGIVIPEPDPAILANSRRLTDQARQIWENLGSTGADRAVQLLDNALALWLDNNAASRLKNEILLSTEPERLPALPAELLNLLSFVDEYYTQGNFILAKAFIDRAINDYPRYSNDPRIRDWKRKVDSRL